MSTPFKIDAELTAANIAHFASTPEGATALAVRLNELGASKAELLAAMHRIKHLLAVDFDHRASLSPEFQEARLVVKYTISKAEGNR